eukprot:CAMPEP_0177595810 /NCGR_PEP_ID=MMETSP0419_2-20121207/10603_1 /TAXON_ID=582737 /ORGANISM="Tetraselmis sp., Strain GSL018" /LENGTH=328 /DNA_ID=CAMNT_0019087391 /DNA_START=976 /DNA_END=1961 /DNA_ORIENTATION=+
MISFVRAALLRLNRIRLVVQATELRIQYFAAFHDPSSHVGARALADRRRTLNLPRGEVVDRLRAAGQRLADHAAGWEVLERVARPDRLPKRQPFAEGAPAALRDGAAAAVPPLLEVLLRLAGAHGEKVDLALDRLQRGDLWVEVDRRQLGGALGRDGRHGPARVRRLLDGRARVAAPVEGREGRPVRRWLAERLPRLAVAARRPPLVELVPAEPRLLLVPSAAGQRTAVAPAASPVRPRRGGVQTAADAPGPRVWAPGGGLADVRIPPRRRRAPLCRGASVLARGGGGRALRRGPRLSLPLPRPLRPENPLAVGLNGAPHAGLSVASV